MFILNIPEPCHERWDEMTPEAKGRFCGSCQKIVVDFTAMSDEQVKTYLLDKKNTNTCGRFYATQIGRPLENKSINIDPVWYQRQPYARQVFYAVAVFFVLGVSSCDFNNTSTAKLNNDTTLNIVKTQENLNQTLGESKMAQTDTVTYKIGFIAPEIMVKEPISYTKTNNMGVPDMEVTQGAPVWQEPLIIDTTNEIMGKIAAPQIPDTVKKTEPMIMGGISLPPKHFEKDSSIHIKKPRR